MYKQRIKELKAAIEPFERELRDLEEKQLANDAPFKVGDIVACKKVKARIKAVLSPWGNGSFDYIGIRIRKDGTEGKRVKIWHWDNPVKVS